MTYIRKPKVEYAGQRSNALGLRLRDYEGGLSTLCAGCGHDSITAAIVQAFFELNIPPYRAAKLSGKPLLVTCTPIRWPRRKRFAVGRRWMRNS